MINGGARPVNRVPAARTIGLLRVSGASAVLSDAADYSPASVLLPQAS